MTSPKTKVPMATRQWVKRRDGFQCVGCGRKESEGTYLEVRHITPVREGGTGHRSNLRTMCQWCIYPEGTAADGVGKA